MHTNGGGEVRDWKRESGSRVGGDGAEASGDEALARTVNDRQSSADNFMRTTGFITGLGAGQNAVGSNSRTEASERVDQTMQEVATDGAEIDAARGSVPMEGVEELLRCNRGPRLIPTGNLHSEVFRR